MPYVVKTFEAPAGIADASFTNQVNDFVSDFIAERKRLYAGGQPDAVDPYDDAVLPEVRVELVTMGEAVFRQARSNSAASVQRAFVFRWTEVYGR